MNTNSKAVIIGLLVLVLAIMLILIRPPTSQCSGSCIPCGDNIDCPQGQLCFDSMCEAAGCPAVVEPVCGVDGNSYGNKCELDLMHVEKSHDGYCNATGEVDKGQISEIDELISGKIKIDEISSSWDGQSGSISLISLTAENTGDIGLNMRADISITHNNKTVYQDYDQFYMVQKVLSGATRTQNVPVAFTFSEAGLYQLTVTLKSDPKQPIVLDTQTEVLEFS